MRRIEYMNETDIKSYAEKTAKTAVERSWRNGNSKDTRRRATAKERQIVSGLIASALMAASDSDWESAHGAADCAEYALMYLLPEKDGKRLNGYDTVYIPVMEYLRGKVK